MPYPNISSQQRKLNIPEYYKDGDYIVGFTTTESSRRTVAQIQTEIDTIDEGTVSDVEKRAGLQAILDGNG